MNILWFSWKDIQHPLAGGAEVVAYSILSRLVKDGHTVTLLTAGYAGATPTDIVHGYRVVRVGGRMSVYWKAYRYYRTNLRGKHDLIVEEINTIPFFTLWYTTGKRVLFFHQLAREIWFYQISFPLSIVGYFVEPLYLRLLSKERVITISESTKNDLARYGFSKENISVVSEGIDMEPLHKLDDGKKLPLPTILSLGSVRPMKRTLDVVKAFELLKTRMPEAKLIIAGDTMGAYGKKVLGEIAKSMYKSDISVLGKVDKGQKARLLAEAHVLIVTSVKEGWGLVVTEANAQGTPAVVYDVDGLRDSVKDGVTGTIARGNTPASLAEAVITTLATPAHYARLRANAWEWSKTITFERQYGEFLNVIK
jgi:glycosyltransferase involved in cell wall biosynthesis